MSKIDIFLLDDLNNTNEELNIEKPNSFQDLINVLKSKLKKLPELYEIFIIDKNNKEEIINDEKYNIIGDILFIRKINKNIIGKSIFQINYDKSDDLNKEILDEKYSCLLCSIIIKNEKPYFCYNCQKLFHEECLKGWDKKCKKQEKNLTCPNCRNDLPIEKWNKKLDYEENRKENANLMNRINLYKINNNMNNNINLINEKKIKELKKENLLKSELIKEYEIFIGKTFEIFKNVLNKINSIYSSLDLKDSIILDKLITDYQINYENLEINKNCNFDNKNNQNSLFYISEYEKIFYKNIFDNQKEPNKERISAHNAIMVWKDNSIDDQVIRDLAKIIKPLENKGFFNLKEFQVACHLIKISSKIKLPPKLPLSLVNFLGRIDIDNISNIIDDKLENLKKYLQNRNKKENNIIQRMNGLKINLDWAQEEIKEMMKIFSEEKEITLQNSNKHNFSENIMINEKINDNKDNKIINDYVKDDLNIEKLKDMKRKNNIKRGFSLPNNKNKNNNLFQKNNDFNSIDRSTFKQTYDKNKDN